MPESKADAKPSKARKPGAGKPGPKQPRAKQPRAEQPTAKQPGSTRPDSRKPGPKKPGPVATRNAHLADAQRQSVERLAEAIFAKRGFRGTTIREVAAKAGCSVGQIYKLYPNKEELFRAIIDSKAELMAGMADQIFRAPASPEERLRRMLLLTLGFAQEHVAFFRIIALETGPNVVHGSTRFFNRVDRSRRELLAQIALVIRDGQRDGLFRAELDPDLTALSFFGMFHGHTTAWLMDREEGQLIDRVDTILDLFFAGARRGRRR